jgi:hypothetical protein
MDSTVEQNAAVTTRTDAPVPPTPAAHLGDLPIDPRWGLLVPAEARWTDDQPVLAENNPYAVVTLTAYRACAVCGYFIPRSEPCWRIFTEADCELARRGARLVGHSIGNEALGHKICMIYSALVCRFWASDRARLSTRSNHPGATRGAEPSILAYRDFGLAVSPYVQIDGNNPPTMIYDDLVDELPFTDPRDLATIYESERKKCGKRYLRVRRYHYAPAFGGFPQLEKDAKIAMDRITTRQPDRQVMVKGALRPLYLAGWV